jgi:hypothetical protein
MLSRRERLGGRAAAPLSRPRRRLGPGPGAARPASYMALPWQADFNECSTQVIDVTYEGWNDLYPDSDHDVRQALPRRGRWAGNGFRESRRGAVVAPIRWNAWKGLPLR